jgi:hypothetical protein
MSDRWGDISGLTFFIGLIFGGGVYVLLKRRLYRRFKPKQWTRIGGIGLGISGLAFGMLPCVLPDVPLSYACAAFLWGMNGFFFLLLSVSDKPSSSKLGE